MFRRIKTFFHNQCFLQLKQTRYEIMNGLITVIESLDPYTRDHSRNVGNYALQLAEALHLSVHEIEIMHYGGLFHDIGKIGISPEILRKEGSLSHDEFCLIKEHPEKGARIIGQFSQFKELVPLVLHHHEKVDGSGYPHGLKGSQIPFGARLIAIVDAYDAMTTNRSYRHAQDHERVLAEFERCAGSHFDSDLVAVFLKMIRK